VHLLDQGGIPGETLGIEIAHLIERMRQRNYRVDRAAVAPIGSWLPKLQA
jgi:hypothetical protein